MTIRKYKRDMQAVLKSVDAMGQANNESIKLQVIGTRARDMFTWFLKKQLNELHFCSPNFEEGGRIPSYYFPNRRIDS